ncbi:MAG: hypothetical protein U0441_04940 [Polyangiaceae bacterium]
MTAEQKQKPRRLSAATRRRLRRALIGGVIAVPVLVGATFYAANHVPWFGAWLADALRSLIGTEAVAELEEFAYDLEDRYNRTFRSGEKPRSYWEAPSGSAVAPVGSVPVAGGATGSATGTQELPSPSASAGAAGSATGAAGSATGAAGRAPFPPEDVGPFDPKFAAAGDGVWVPVPVPGVSAQAGSGEGGKPSSNTEPLFYKTLIHPDGKRPWAEVLAVAMNPKTALLHLVAGVHEPHGTAPGSGELKRTGLIPDTDVPSLMAAWNGGFKEEHGHYGMKLDGVLVVRPRADACTIAMNADETLRIAPWKAVSDIEGTFKWWRQTPSCLVDGGKLHPALFDENTHWGAAIGGGTVVRRSALGLSEDGGVLYMVVSNSTSPRTLALAMQHLRAYSAAQLDINYSYPRYVLFPKADSGQREATSLFEGFKVDKDDYLRTANPRDFFYVTRR